MTRVTRRMLLGSAAATATGAVFATGAAGATTSAAFDTAPARAALGRLLPRHAGQFRLVALGRGNGGKDGERSDRFRIAGARGRIEVAGTSQATLLCGVRWYLKHVCGVGVSWVGDSLDALPATLPAPPPGGIARRATVPHRFVLNDTNDGYTAPYADWSRWERFIDVLALHGCNEVLVVAGAEAVYRRVLREFGYSDKEALAWLPAPSHQPWWLLQNLSGYGGPLTSGIVDARAALGRRITARLRELGMAPVLPGYFGTVPDGFAGRNAGAHVVPQGTWHGFARPGWLDPRTDAFAAVASSFYRHQKQLFGEAAYFKMDLLHEGGTAGGVPVAAAARGVQAALRAAHPRATWVILGWEKNPRADLLEAVDKERMLVVDGVSDRFASVTDRERDWAGTPYAFGSIPNFGGRTTIGAKAHVWADRFFSWRDKPGSALAGTCYLPEAAERDPAAFELFCELPWHEQRVDLPTWFDTYARTRYGTEDGQARVAWQALRRTAYRHDALERADAHDSLFTARPSLTADSSSVYAPNALTYDPAAFDAAFAALLAVSAGARGCDAYRYDLTDVARQAVANRSRQLLPQLRAAFARGDAAVFHQLSELWLRLMRLADEVAGGHRAFLLGPWLAEARDWGGADAQRAKLERTARVLTTTWGGRATSVSLHEYANRDWNGLVADFYLPRWRTFLDECAAALTTRRTPRAVDWYRAEEPWTKRAGRYPTRPTGDAHTLARRAYGVLAAAPYQGTLTVTADPVTLVPGGRAVVTAEFANTNGLAPTGTVGFSLTTDGLRAAPRGTLSLPRVAAGGTGRATWHVTAPEARPKRPLSPLRYEARAAYEPVPGGARVPAVATGDLYVAGPLDRAYRTVNGTGAVFGQLGDRFAIDGAGRDLWKGTAEFAAVLRPGALRDGGTVTTRVDSQAETAAWARAGIVVRDDLDDPAAPGFLNLAVSPGHGVTLSYDSDGDGLLNRYRRLAGVRAPVLLRLRRRGRAYTGECSTDGGTTWRKVATVTVPAAARTQDVGLFMTAGNGGTGDHGLVEFTGFRVT